MGNRRDTSQFPGYCQLGEAFQVRNPGWNPRKAAYIHHIHSRTGDSHQTNVESIRNRKRNEGCGTTAGRRTGRLYRVMRVACDRRYRAPDAGPITDFRSRRGKNSRRCAPKSSKRAIKSAWRATRARQIFGVYSVRLSGNASSRRIPHILSM